MSFKCYYDQSSVNGTAPGFSGPLPWGASVHSSCFVVVVVVVDLNQTSLY